MNTYSTWDEAVNRQIIEPIEASGVVKDARAEFDVETIAERIITATERGYVQEVDTDTFWRIVEEHARPENEPAPPIHPSLRAVALAAVEAGLELHVEKPRTGGDARFFYVGHPDHPEGAGIVSTGGPLEPPVLTAPIAPNRRTGSAVQVDYDGTPEGAARALAALIERGEVEERFVDSPRTLPLDTRFPINAVRVTTAEQLAN